MTIIEALKTWPDELAVPLCRYFDVTDRYLSALEEKVAKAIVLVQDLETPEAPTVRKRLNESKLVIESVRNLVEPTDEVRRYWHERGSYFDYRNCENGDGAKLLENVVLEARRLQAANPGDDELVLHYLLCVYLCFRGISREELFQLHLPEIEQRQFTYLSLVFDRLQFAMRDLEDTSVVVRQYYPEDDSPLDVGQYGFDLPDYDKVRDALTRLIPSEKVLLAMIVRQYCRRLKEHFPDLTVFQYALRKMGSEGIVSVSMKAVPLVQQLAEDLKVETPEGRELEFLMKEGFVDPILNFRSRSILRYATSQAWPLASLLRLVNLHLIFVLDQARDLSATEFLDFIYNDTIDEETIRRNLSKENGLTESVAQNFTALRQVAPRALVRALAASFETAVPILETLVKESEKGVGHLFQGTPVEHFDDDGVRQLFLGVRRYLTDLKDECPRETFPTEAETMLEMVKDETPSLKAHIEETCEKLSEHDAREVFRALIAFWSVSVVLIRNALATRERLPDSIDQAALDTNFRFIVVGTSELIRRFQLLDFNGEGKAADPRSGETPASSVGGNDDMPPPSMLN